MAAGADQDQVSRSQQHKQSQQSTNQTAVDPNVQNYAI